MSTETEKRLDTLLAALVADPTYAKTPALLAYELHWEPETIQPLVDQARRQGHPILDNERGYYLGTSKEDIVDWQMHYAFPRLADLLEQLGAMNCSARKLWRRDA